MFLKCMLSRQFLFSFFKGEAAAVGLGAVCKGSLEEEGVVQRVAGDIDWGGDT